MRGTQRTGKGFTLIELMVVIVIIVMLAGISIPAMGDFMRKRRLRGSGDQIQSSCMRMRSRAIAQRERQYLAFFVQSGTYTAPWVGTPNLRGDMNSIHAFDSNESEPTPQVLQLEEDSIVYLPEFVRFETPATNFMLTFHVDGTVEFNTGIGDNAIDPDLGNATDMVLRQTDNQGLGCYIDMVANTGRLRYLVRYTDLQE